MFYEPADGALPVENRWSTRKYLASTPAVFEAARAALGWDIDLLHDAHHRLTPIEAAQLVSAGALPVVLAGRYRCGGQPGFVPAHSSAHHHAACRGEVFNSIGIANS